MLIISKDSIIDYNNISHFQTDFFNIDNSIQYFTPELNTKTIDYNHIEVSRAWIIFNAFTKDNNVELTLHSKLIYLYDFNQIYCGKTTNHITGFSTENVVKDESDFYNYTKINYYKDKSIYTQIPELAKRFYHKIYVNRIKNNLESKILDFSIEE